MSFMFQVSGFKFCNPNGSDYLNINSDTNSETVLIMSYLTLITTDSIRGKLMGRDAQARNLVFFLYEEWHELFFVVLKCPGYVRDYTNESIEEANLKRKEVFLKALPDYPLLARINDVYQDVFYSSNELPGLIKECEMIKDDTDNPTALSGLRKLIAKCAEAAEFGLGLKLRAN